MLDPLLKHTLLTTLSRMCAYNVHSNAVVVMFIVHADEYINISHCNIAVGSWSSNIVLMLIWEIWLLGKIGLGFFLKKILYRVVGEYVELSSQELMQWLAATLFIRIIFSHASRRTGLYEQNFGKFQ